MKIMVTGHRPERLNGKEKEVEAWLRNYLQNCSTKIECITGCAKGVDSIFADVVMELNLPLICAFPYKLDCNHNERILSEPEQKMKDYAKEVHWQTGDWYKNCYLDRDKWMVDHSDVVLVVWDGIPKGGTYYTMEYAKKKNKLVLSFPWASLEQIEKEEIL